MRGVPLDCLWFRVSLRPQDNRPEGPSLEPLVARYARVDVEGSYEDWDFTVSLIAAGFFVSACGVWPSKKSEGGARPAERFLLWLRILRRVQHVASLCNQSQAAASSANQNKQSLSQSHTCSTYARGVFEITNQNKGIIWVTQPTNRSMVRTFRFALENHARVQWNLQTASQPVDHKNTKHARAPVKCHH